MRLLTLLNKALSKTTWSDYARSERARNNSVDNPSSFKQVVLYTFIVNLAILKGTYFPYFLKKHNLNNITNTKLRCLECMWLNHARSH